MSLEVVLSLVVVGLLMILCEVFIPGGVVGSVGAVVLAIGIVGGFTINMTLGMGLLSGSLVLGVIGLWLWTKYFPRSSMGKRLILQTDAKLWHGYDDSKKFLVGKTGVTHTPLRPTGTAIIDGRRLDVVTQGEMIAPRLPVQVIEVEGNRVVVALITETSQKVDENSA